jgi:hypothetical protein
VCHSKPQSLTRSVSSLSCYQIPPNCIAYFHYDFHRGMPSRIRGMSGSNAKPGDRQKTKSTKKQLKDQSKADEGGSLSLANARQQSANATSGELALSLTSTLASGAAGFGSDAFVLPATRGPFTESEFATLQEHQQLRALQSEDAARNLQLLHLRRQLQQGSVGGAHGYSPHPQLPASRGFATGGGGDRGLSSLTLERFPQSGVDPTLLLDSSASYQTRLLLSQMGSTSGRGVGQLSPFNSSMANPRSALLAHAALGDMPSSNRLASSVQQQQHFNTSWMPDGREMQEETLRAESIHRSTDLIMSSQLMASRQQLAHQQQQQHSFLGGSRGLRQEHQIYGSLETAAATPISTQDFAGSQMSRQEHFDLVQLFLRNQQFLEQQQQQSPNEDGNPNPR